MDGNVFVQVRYQQLIFIRKLIVIHNKNANIILHIVNSAMSCGSLLFIILIGCSSVLHDNFEAFAFTPMV